MQYYKIIEQKKKLFIINIKTCGEKDSENVNFSSTEAIGYIG